MSNTPYSTKAPTNPCCSVFDPFRPSKSSLGFMSNNYTGWRNVKHAEFRDFDPGLQQLPPDQPGMNQPQWNKECPVYNSTLFLDKLPRDDRPSECARPPSKVWYETGTYFRSRGK